MPGPINTSYGIVAGNGTTTHTINFTTDGSSPFTPTNGRLLVFIIGGAVTNTNAGGWTEQLQPVSGCELSVFTITASSTTSITITNNGSNYPETWWVFEFAAGSVYQAGTSNLPTVGTSGVSRAWGNTLSGLSGTSATIIAAVSSGNTSGGSVTFTTAWSAPFTLVSNQTAPATGGADGLGMGVASTTGYTSTSVQPTWTPTWSNPGSGWSPDFQQVLFAITDATSTAFTRDYASTWRVFNAVTRDYVSTWRVLNALTADYASTWRVLNAITRDYASTWRVLNAFNSDYASTWRVFNALLRDYASTWRVLNSWTSDYSSTWRVFNAFARDYASTWDVLAGTAFVRDFSSTWRVYNSLTADYASSWRVLGSFARDYAGTWRVFNALIRDYSSTWRVFRVFTRDYTSTWAVLGQTPGGLVLQVWNGSSLVAVTSLAVWNGTTAIPATVESIV